MYHTIHQALRSIILFKIRLSTAYKIAIAFDKIIENILLFINVPVIFYDIDPNLHAPNLLLYHFNGFPW